MTDSTKSHRVVRADLQGPGTVLCVIIPNLTQLSENQILRTRAWPSLRP